MNEIRSELVHHHKHNTAGSTFNDPFAELPAARKERKEKEEREKDKKEKHKSKDKDKDKKKDRKKSVAE